jgi:tetratricopeptide (TPR) repeat protein
VIPKLCHYRLISDFTRAVPLGSSAGPCAFCVNGACRAELEGAQTLRTPQPQGQSGGFDASHLDAMLKDLSQLERQEKADLFFNEGEKLYQRREFARALIEYRKTQIANPHYVKAFIRAGDIHCLQASYYEAIDQYKAVVRQEQGRGEIWIRLILQYRFTYRGTNQEQMYRNQIERYRAQVAENPSNAMLHFVLGMCELLLPLKEPRGQAKARALREFLSAVELDPDCLWGYWGQKYAHLFMGEDLTGPALEAATAACVEARKRSFGDLRARAYVELAECYELAAYYSTEETGSGIEEALETYGQALVFDPFDLNASLRVGILKRRNYEFDAAIDALKLVTDREPLSFLAALELARIYKDLGRQDDAIEEYDAFVDLIEHYKHFPSGMIANALDLARASVADVRTEMAQVYRDKAMPDRAMSLLRQVTTTSPDHRAAHLAYISLRLDDLGETREPEQIVDGLEKEYRDQILRDPNSPFPRYALAMVFHLAALAVPRQREAYMARAVTECKKALTLNRDFPEVTWLLKDLLLANSPGDEATYQKALTFCRAVLAMHPEEAESHYQLGQTYLHGDDFEKALECFREAIARDSAYLPAYYKLAMLYNKLERYDLAVEVCKQVQKFKPHDAKAHHELGQVFYQKGDFEAADIELARAIELNPRFLDPYLMSGQLALEQGQHEKALAQFQKVLDVQPSNDAALYRAGQILNHVGQYGEARQHLNRLLESDPRNLPALIEMARSLWLASELPEALEAYKKILGIDPKNVTAHFQIGDIHARMEDPDRAIEAFRAVLAANPSHRDAYLRLGEIYTDKGVMFEAEKMYRKAAGLAPDDTAPNLGLARIYKAQKNYRQAAEELSKLIEKDPENAGIHFELAQTAAEQHDNRTAFRHYRRARELDPQNVSYALAQGELHFQLGEQGLAEECYQDVMRHDFKNITIL